ncbi:MAG: glycosyltransferase [Pseudomonadota bacterium]
MRDLPALVPSGSVPIRAPAPLDPELSYRFGPAKWQIRTLIAGLATLGIAALLIPLILTTALAWALFGVFFLLVLWRALLVLAGFARRMLDTPGAPEPPQALEWPIYSILIPLYQEAALVDQLAAALWRLDWPIDRLDIQVLLEADDAETLAAVKAARFPPGTRHIVVPPGGPRTKPHALNAGLATARGRFLTVYDAEDIPHPDQLIAAYDAFRRAPADTVCFQAPLIAENAQKSWLAAQWGLEYQVQFGLLLPALATYEMPLLIGGTSNHFRTSALQALGGWDAWNVTEDADLGMRIARAGMRCGTLQVPTGEDAPTGLFVWLRQRSRWIKGFMQTWLVLMREPRRTQRQMGTIPFLTMHLNLGGAILAPIAHAPCVLCLSFAVLAGDQNVGIFGLSLLIAALFVGALGDLLAPGDWTLSRVIALLTRPLYWPLLTVAAVRAIWELVVDPFFWAKTPHSPRAAESLTPCLIGSSASASPSP